MSFEAPRVNIQVHCSNILERIFFYLFLLKVDDSKLSVICKYNYNEREAWDLSRVLRRVIGQSAPSSQIHRAVRPDSMKITLLIFRPDQGSGAHYLNLHVVVILTGNS